MPWIKCPHCGEWHEITEVRDSPPSLLEQLGLTSSSELSPVAFAILSNQANLPKGFRQGNSPVAIRTLADLIGYSSKEHVRQGLLELKQLGVVKTISYGNGPRKRYVGVPGKLRALKRSA